LPQFRNTKIQNLQPPVARQPKVPGFQVAMHNPMFMRGSQTIAQLDSQSQGFLLRQRSRRQLLAQSASGDVLHHQEVQAMLGVEVVNSCYIGVVELGQGESFFAKALTGGIVE